MPAAGKRVGQVNGVDFVVHTSGEVGSPRVCGSTNARKAGASPGVVLDGRLAAAAGRPHPPGRLDTALEFPHALGHRVRVHPGRQSNRLDPAPAQLRRLRADQQAALPFV